MPLSTTTSQLSSVAGAPLMVPRVARHAPHRAFDRRPNAASDVFRCLGVVVVVRLGAEPLAHGSQHPFVDVGEHQVPEVKVFHIFDAPSRTPEQPTSRRARCPDADTLPVAAVIPARPRTAPSSPGSSRLPASARRHRRRLRLHGGQYRGTSAFSYPQCHSLSSCDGSSCTPWTSGARSSPLRGARARRGPWLDPCPGGPAETAAARSPECEPREDARSPH